MGHSIIGRIALVVLCASGCGARTEMDVDLPEEHDAGRDASTPHDAASGEVVCDREVSIAFTPTARVQLGVWATGGGRFATVALTEATAYRGIGNRPGALQMNSGYRWPYGRRENVLPGWASARLDAGGVFPFRRVIYRGRNEGFASPPGSTPDEYRDTDDPYFCLPFAAADTRRDGLDAITCASPLNDDKGRYFDDDDLAAGYAEPVELMPGVGDWRVLSRHSAYPPRRDLTSTDGDHPDVAQYAADALAVMPELDAVTMATPRAEEPFALTWSVPDSWPAGPVRVSIEVNTEGDYGPAYDPSSYPTPIAPDGAWDHWAQSYGYPYRGQPSVIFDVDVVLPPRDGRAAPTTSTADRPARRGTLDASLEVVPIDDTIVDDPTAAPGSGADRLRRRADGARVVIEARQVRCRAP